MLSHWKVVHQEQNGKRRGGREICGHWPIWQTIVPRESLPIIIQSFTCMAAAVFYCLWSTFSPRACFFTEPLSSAIHRESTNVSRYNEIFDSRNSSRSYSNILWYCLDLCEFLPWNSTQDRSSKFVGAGFYCLLANTLNLILSHHLPIDWDHLILICCNALSIYCILLLRVVMYCVALQYI